MSQIDINPRTDGGPGHLSTDGEGRITAPPDISKTKQARDKQLTALDTDGWDIQFFAVVIFR